MMKSIGMNIIILVFKPVLIILFKMKEISNVMNLNMQVI